MHKTNCFYLYMISIFLLVFLILSVPISCLARSPAEDKVSVLYNKYRQLLKLGRYQEATKYAEELVTAGEKAFGKDHPNVAIFLNNLAERYRTLGDYAKAEPLYKRSLAIVEKTYGPKHPHVARGLNNLAALYDSLGDYASAEPLYKRSLTIKEKTLGAKHPSTAISLNNLAGLYTNLGDYTKAEPLYIKSLAILEKALGPNHPDVAKVLNSLAMLYWSIGDYTRAMRLLERSLSIKEKTLGPEHPNVAKSLINLAALYTTLGDYTRAEPLYKRSLAMMEKALGPEHPDVAKGLDNLAGLYYSFGDLVKAKPLLEKSLAIREKTFGPEHPDVALSLNNLALLYASTDDFENSHKLFKRAQEIDSKLIDQVIGFTSEEQKIKFLSTKKYCLNLFLSLIDQHLSQKPSARKDALNAWLKRKGVILEAQRRFQEALVYSDDLQAVKTFQDLSRIRARLSKLAFAGPGKEGLKAWKNRMADLEVQKERLEAILSRLSQTFALKQKISKADCEKVAGALPPKTVLIEFARVEILNFKTKWLSAHHLAFLLHSGKGNRVGLIDLGDAYLLDKAIERFKKEIATIRKIKGERIIKSSREIYDLVFEPIKRELGNVKEIFISPDGNLNLIPFEVLQGPDGRFLIEDYTFNYLAAGRDVLGFGEIKERGKKVLLMGDPDFDLGAKEKDSTLRKLALNMDKEEIVKRSSDMGELHFNRLPGTREEVTSIKAILVDEKVELYIGKEALEEVLKQKGAPKILHLATHGFFLSDVELSYLRDEIMLRGISISLKSTGKSVKIKNPLLRSGIALAGANSALKSRDAEKSDGIVTAEKILGIRLRGTDMVVLSACETGVGEVKTGEGVFGLRRAFTQAGTRSLVMSMWSVPDKETKELMIEFYKNILSGKMNRCQALRQAALNEMKIVKARYGHTNPFYWGAFLFMGEP
jgi:CHAT domain-containing protein/Tfp pilus assembly protein PilF